MAKIRSKVITSPDREYLATLRLEYISLGFETSLEGNDLIVYSTKKKKKNKDKKKS